MKEISILEEMVLIAIFRLKNDAYGVTIRKKITDATQKDVIYGTLYNTLDQLVRKGHLKKIRGQPTKERGGRSKMFYSLTLSGINALQDSRDLHQKLWDGIKELTLDKN